MKKIYLKKIYWLALAFLFFVNISPAWADTITEFQTCQNYCQNDYRYSAMTAADGATLSACQKSCANDFPQGCQDSKQCAVPGTVVGMQSQTSNAAEQTTADCGKAFCLNVAIGKVNGFSIGENILGQYIQSWYGFLLGTIGILATVMVMWGGFKYLTSRGDKGQIDSAKTSIVSAITGLILAFGTYTLLYLINPALVTITTPDLKPIQGGGNVNLTQPYSYAANSVNLNGVTYNRDTNGNFPNAAYATHDTASYLAANEGYRDQVYLDQTGNPTIGYGHKCVPADYSRGGICSGVNTDGTAMTSEQVKAQSDALFNQQMGEANTAARSLLANVPGATADRIMVVTDLFYNQGSLTNMPLTRDAIQAGKWDEAANQLLYANGTLASGPTLYATQVGVRATRDAIILRTGSSDNLK